MGDALIALLALVKEADSIELKLTIPESSYRSTVVSLGVDPLDAQLRQVYFLDTPDLQLDAAGVVARFRRVQGRRSDSVVKLRPVVPSELDPALRSSPDFGVEVDAMPGGYVCSASMKQQAVRQGRARGGGGDQARAQALLVRAARVLRHVRATPGWSWTTCRSSARSWC